MMFGPRLRWMKCCLSCDSFEKREKDTGFCKVRGIIILHPAYFGKKCYRYVRI